MRIVLSAFTAAMAVGFVGAKWLPGGSRETEARPVTGMKREDRRNVRWQSDDLETWATKGGRLSDPFSGEWKNWSERELRAALEEGVKDPGMAMSRGVERKVMLALLGEWMRRNPDEALSWIERSISESMRKGLISAVSENWPADRAAEGLDYVIANRDWFESDDGTGSSRLIRGAIEEAALREADAVGELFGTLRENRLNPMYGGGWQFSAGFDFAALASHPETQRMKSSFFAGIWMSRNPEEAFAHLVAGVAPAEAKVDNLFSDVLPMNGTANREAAAARAGWLAEKLDALPEADRNVMATRISSTIPDPATRGRFIRGLSDDVLQRATIESSMEDMTRHGIKGVADFLEQAVDGDQRLEALESVKLAALPDRSEAARATLEAKLLEWNAPPDRAQAIMEKFTNPFAVR